MEEAEREKRWRFDVILEIRVEGGISFALPFFVFPLSLSGCEKASLRCVSPLPLLSRLFFHRRRSVGRCCCIVGFTSWIGSGRLCVCLFVSLLPSVPTAALLFPPDSFSASSPHPPPLSISLSDLFLYRIFTVVCLLLGVSFTTIVSFVFFFFFFLRFRSFGRMSEGERYPGEGERRNCGRTSANK